MGVETFLAPVSVTLGQGPEATEADRNLPCPHDKIRTANPIAAAFDMYIKHVEEFCNFFLLAIFSCDQAALWMVFSVRLSVCLSVCPPVTDRQTMFP